MAIDAEGAICILRQHAKKNLANGKMRSTRHFLHVTVMNTDLRLLDWARDTFGGGIYSTATGSGQFKKRRECYAWCVSSGYAEQILVGCLSFFIIKRDQADLALTFQRTFHGSRLERLPDVPRSTNGVRLGLRPEVIEFRESLKLKMTEIKQIA
jgi:hypothetical protein